MNNIELSHVLLAMLLVLASFPVLAVGKLPPRAVDHGEPAIDQLVHDVCNKRIVLLGEDAHHGGGKTLETKTQIVERLVNRCGFRGMLFESSFYEFVHFQSLVNRGTATSKNLTDSIGAIWTTAAESRPLVKYLFAKAKSGTVKIGGLDPQVGSSTARYEATQLAGDLVKYLSPDKRKPCLSALNRNDRWDYDEAHPYNLAAKKEMLGCIASIRAVLAQDHHKDEVALRAAAMARSYDIDLKMARAPK